MREHCMTLRQWVQRQNDYKDNQKERKRVTKNSP